MFLRRVRLLSLRFSFLFTCAAGSAIQSTHAHELVPIPPNMNATRSDVLWDLASRPEGVVVDVNDKVVDGCWPSPPQSKETMLLVARSQGWRVDPSPANRFLNVIITAIGKEVLPDFCVSAISIEVKIGARVILAEPLYTYQNVDIVSLTVLVHSRKERHQRELDSSLVRAIEDILSNVD